MTRAWRRLVATAKEESGVATETTA
jgi:hypothetical protein